MAEKLETVISRATTNTRMRDFYDLHILCQLYGGTLTAQVLTDALCATARSVGRSDCCLRRRMFCGSLRTIPT